MAISSFPGRSMACAALMTGALAANPATSAPVTQTLQASVPLRQLASGRIIHRFFDTSPISPSGRYVALFRVPSETLSPKPGDSGEVVLVDLQSHEERVVARTRGFEMQLGANVQWGASDEDLFFNDVDPATWQAFAVRLNPLTGATRRMAGTVFMASADGSKLASYNLLNSRRAQVGYGVMVPDAQARRNIGPVDTDGIDITDVATNQVRRIVTLRQIYENSVPSLHIAQAHLYEFYLFQVKWNPQGTRLLTTIQWAPLGGGPRQRAVVTMRPDGSDLRTAITPEQWARGGHHVNWTADGEHLSMNLDVDDKPGLEIITVRYDGSDLRTVFAPGSGHPSFHPTDARYLVTDAYPNEPVTSGDGVVPVRLLNVATGQEQAVAKLYVSNTGGEFRIDPHPAWDRSGRYVVFNGFVGGTRNVYLADLSKLIPAVTP